MADVMEWDDLPTTRQQANADHDARIAFLQQEPGRWARIPGGFSSSSKAGALSQALRKYAEKRDIPLESATRNAEGVVYVWARIVPESETESDSAE